MTISKIAAALAFAAASLASGGAMAQHAYLLAGASDDITTPEQVLDAAKLIGTPASKIVSKTVPGGHIGLFMGARTLKEHWPVIGRWIVGHSKV